MWFDPWVRKVPLEEGTATHSSILAWRIQWTEQPGGQQSIRWQRVSHSDTAEATQHAHMCCYFSLLFLFLFFNDCMLKLTNN